MRVTIVVEPAGGGKPEYQLPIEMPSLPREGDYITVKRVDQKGEIAWAEDRLSERDDKREMQVESFKVRKIHWDATYPYTEEMVHEAGKDPVGKLSEVFVHCEMAVGVWDSPSHKTIAGPNAVKLHNEA